MFHNWHQTLLFILMVPMFHHWHQTLLFTLMVPMFHHRHQALLSLILLLPSFKTFFFVKHLLMKLLLLLLMLLQFQWTVRFFAAALSSLIHLLTLLSGMPGGVLLERQSYLLKNLLLLKKSTIANDFGGAYENAPGPLSMISEPFVCSRDELLFVERARRGESPRPRSSTSLLLSAFQRCSWLFRS